jgi:hypothetical protein
MVHVQNSCSNLNVSAADGRFEKVHLEVALEVTETTRVNVAKGYDVLKNLVVDYANGTRAVALDQIYRRGAQRTCWIPLLLDTGVAAAYPWTNYFHWLRRTSSAGDREITNEKRLGDAPDSSASRGGDIARQNIIEYYPMCNRCLWRGEEFLPCRFYCIN